MIRPALYLAANEPAIGDAFPEFTSNSSFSFDAAMLNERPRAFTIRIMTTIPLERIYRDCYILA
jgi:hypothetical protein